MLCTIKCQLAQCACAHESSIELGYYGVDHTPHCRPRAAAQTHRVMAMFSLCSNIESTTRPWQRAASPLALLEVRWPAQQACRNMRRLRHSLELKNASLWPLGPGNLVCAHGTTISTIRESSELVGASFIPSRLGHGLYKKMKIFFVLYSITISILTPV